MQMICRKTKRKKKHIHEKYFHERIMILLDLTIMLIKPWLNFLIIKLNREKIMIYKKKSSNTQMYAAKAANQSKKVNEQNKDERKRFEL